MISIPVDEDCMKAARAYREDPPVYKGNPAFRPTTAREQALRRETADYVARLQLDPASMRGSLGEIPITGSTTG